MYNSQNPNLRSSKSMFKRIFYNEFNIGFSSPASDACGTCLNLRNVIKEGGKNKTTLMTELRVHKVRAKTFYTLLKENPENSMSFCFDLQQVHPLPKTPIQDAFYLRQISFYTFCCVDVDSKKPFFYTWTENQASRGSTEVGSALIAHLRSLDLTDNNIKLLRLFCHGCGGQNKNSYIMHLLAFWLKNEAPKNLEEIVIHFPVRGHSYLPADRAFGRAEKVLKKHVVIHNPTEYNTVYSQVGTVRELGKDWNLYNVKELSEAYMKVTAIKDLKRIFIRKFSPSKGCIIEYRGCSFFRFENVTQQKYLPFLKRGRKEGQLEELLIGKPIPLEKKKNVKALLEKQFNNADMQWQNLPSLEFFKPILDEGSKEAEQEYVEENEPIDDEACDCLEDDLELHL
nr:unnamed protein product [Callosobruchus chinensis]